MIPKLNKYNFIFPSVENANEDGIVAWGGDLHPTRIYTAYQNGIFPWYGKDEPILWWSPDPRFILELSDFKISKSLKKNIKKFTYKFDTNFYEVIKQCSLAARAGQNGTWLQEEMIEAYQELHHLNIAHSVETYYDGKLIGGLYGISIGSIFCGESMFSYKSDASKAALAILVKHLTKWKYTLIDAQVPTSHLRSLGAKEISRRSYMQRLLKAKEELKHNKWEIDLELLKS
jgi:leucyl/phenylalanyl-tRNA--protein transferase